MEYTTKALNYSVGDLEAPKLFTVQTTDNPNSIEKPVLLEVRGWSTSDLVSFGNYMLSTYPSKKAEAEASGDVMMGVTDANIANWKELCKQVQE